MTFLTVRQAADLIGVTPARLYQRRVAGTGPKFVRCPQNGALRYRRTDVEKWIAEQAFFRLHSPDLDPPKSLEKKIARWTKTRTK